MELRSRALPHLFAALDVLTASNSCSRVSSWRSRGLRPRGARANKIATSEAELQLHMLGGPRRSLAGTQIPVENLLAGPEHHAGPGLHVVQGFSKVAKPVGGPHDVGMDDQGHDSCRVVRIRVQLVELIDRAVPV